MKIGKFSRKRSQWGNSPRNQKICSEIGGKSETEGGNASLPQGGWTPLSSKISHVSPVSDSRGEANPDMTLIQFGYRLWATLQRRNKHEILGNISNWPPTECLH